MKYYKESFDPDSIFPGPISPPVLYGSLKNQREQRDNESY